MASLLFHADKLFQFWKETIKKRRGRQYQTRAEYQNPNQST